MLTLVPAPSLLNNAVRIFGMVFKICVVSGHVAHVEPIQAVLLGSIAGNVYMRGKTVQSSVLLPSSLFREKWSSGQGTH